MVLSLLIAGLAVSPPAGPKANMSTLTDRQLVQCARELPDLRLLAREQVDERHPERDVYVIARELERRWTAERRPYVTSMPLRMPPGPCSTGAHQVAHVDLTIVDPRGPTPETLKVSERELHEVEQHGRALTPAQRAFLLALARR